MVCINKKCFLYDLSVFLLERSQNLIIHIAQNFLDKKRKKDVVLYLKICIQISCFLDETFACPKLKIKC